MIDLTFVERLLELLNASNAGSIEVRKTLFNTSVKVSKATGAENAGPMTYQVSAAPAASIAGSSPVTSEAARGESPAAEASPSAKLHEIKSPMVGTFYAQPEPGAEPYVQVGSRIAPGQNLCIIEAMKIMNTIDADVAGVIKEVCVQDAQPVEFGQALFKVDTNG